MPGKVHPNTMAFLADLRDNNEREWLKSELKDFLLSRGWVGLNVRPLG